MSRPPAYVVVGRADSLAAGQMRECIVDGIELVLVNVDGEIFALGNRCPHQGGPLSKGSLKGDELTCAWHCWSFDARTGRPRWPDGVWRLPRYPIKIEDGQIHVRIG